MLKKPYKILTILVLMSLTSFLTVIKNSHYMLLNEYSAYENAMNGFKKKYSPEKDSKFHGPLKCDGDSTISRAAASNKVIILGLLSSHNWNQTSQAWKLMDPVNFHLRNMSVEERKAVVQEYPPGMDGKPAYLKNDLRGSTRMMVKKGWTDHAFNEFISELIPLNRTLPDPRHPSCKTQQYLNLLPPASVVICFHNEAWSTLIRTVQSVLRNSPTHLLDEIILYDDNSTMHHLGASLDDYVLKTPKVSLLRGTKREGLIRARVNAAKKVKSPVIIFLDSHCECTTGWLEPLLDRLGRDKRKVACPVVDHIHDNTFEYIPQDITNLKIGGFTWDLKFAWKSIPREAKRGSLVSPVKTPTISGGIFAISRDFFQELGYYDEGFELWGAENLELSFKAWMCGGSMEMVPCSHVGHVFRNRFPYKANKASFMRNNMRLAEVWLDKYAKHFYNRIGNQKMNFGNVTSRVQLRKELKCKSFEWYLKNVYVDMELPDSYVASGQVYTFIKGRPFCLDAHTSQQSYTGDVDLMVCHHTGGNQFWIYTKNGKIKRDNYCLEYNLNKVKLYLCRERARAQIWLYDQKTFYIKHKESQKCLKPTVQKNSQHVAYYGLILDNCKNVTSQKWMVENFDIKKLDSELRAYVSKSV